jgi:thioredoxin 1
MQIVNKEELKDLLSKNNKILIDFFATWCGPCRALSPVLEKLESEYPNVKFVKFDVDTDMEYVTQFNITSVPTVMICNGDEIIDVSKGVKPSDYYKKILLEL